MSTNVDRPTPIISISYLTLTLTLCDSQQSRVRPVIMTMIMTMIMKQGLRGLIPHALGE